VAEELGRLSGCPLDKERCGQYFREVIRNQYEAKLEDNVHFRFVRFAFDETGVGRDRSRIVRDFLEKLREASFANPAGLDLEDRVDEFFREYRRTGTDGDDVEALGQALRRCGLALLRLAADVRTRGLALECSLWDWPQLRHYWLERSGVDLDRLLPEAKEIFSALLQRLGDRVSREELARILADGRLRVTGPPGVALTPQDPRRLALMPICLEHVSAWRELVVTDQFGLTADAIQGHPPNTWHLRGGDWVFFWRPQAFGVRLSPWSREASVPLFSGRRLADTRLVGHFWSGSLAHGELPVIEGATLCPAAAPRLRVAHCWWVDHSGLTLQLLGFRADFFEFKGDLCLRAGNDPLWRGRLCSGRPTEKPAHGWQLAGCQQLSGPELEIALIDDEGRTLVATRIPNPAVADFVAVDGRVDPDRKVLWIGEGVEARSFPRGILLFSRRNMAPQVDLGRFEEVNAGHAWKGFTVFRLVPDADGVAPVCLRTAISRWTLRRGPCLSLEIVAATNLVCGDVELSGEDGLRLVESEDPILVRLHGWSEPTASPEEGAAQLWLRTERATYRWPLSDLGRPVAPGEPLEVSLLTVARSLRGNLPFGWMSLGLQGSQVEESESHIYRLVGQWVPQTARQGEHARLALLHNGQLLAQIESDTVLRWAEMLERKRVWGRLGIGEQGTLVAGWNPLLCDVGLFRRDNPVTDLGPLDVTVLSENVELRCLGDAQAGWTVMVDGVPIDVSRGPLIPLSELLAKAPPNASSLTLAVALGGETIRSWTVDLKPKQIAFDPQWQELSAGKDFCLRVHLRWLGLPAQEMMLQLLAGDRVMEEKPIGAAGSGHVSVSRSYETIFSLLKSEIAYLHEQADAGVALCLEGKPVARHPLPPPPVGGQPEWTPEEIKEEIRRIWRTRERTPEQEDQLAEQTLYLTELYLREENKMPFASVAGMASKLDGRGSRESREAITLGYRLLERMGTSAEPSDEAERSPAIGSKLGLFLLTLWAIHQTRMKEAGQALSERFAALADAFTVNDVPDAASKIWARAMAAYCDHQRADLDSRPEQDITDFSYDELEQLKHSPLIGFDPSLNLWLESLHCERVSQ